MMSKQSIAAPFGITVFGSAIIRVLPDVVVIRFSVSQVEQHPKAAFEAVRESAQKLQTYLNSTQIKDAGSSRIYLTEEYRYQHNENKFIGYRASVEFRIMLTDLSRVEEILAGAVDVGASGLSVDFQITKLKEFRAEARRQAVAAAREKAEVYCKAANVEVGEVIHIEDVNPDQLALHSGTHNRRIENLIEDDGESQAFDPSSITIGGAVMVAYKIQGSKS
jgi:uncharacterized protein